MAALAGLGERTGERGGERDEGEINIRKLYSEKEGREGVITNQIIYSMQYMFISAA